MSIFKKAVWSKKLTLDLPKMLRYVLFSNKSLLRKDKKKILFTLKISNSLAFKLNRFT